jgi:hypothetical protein
LSWGLALTPSPNSLSLRATLPLLFRVTIIERGGQERDAVAERLTGALISWDCHEDLNFIEPSMRSRLEEVFREVLAEANEVAAVVP